MSKPINDNDDIAWHEHVSEMDDPHIVLAIAELEGYNVTFSQGRVLLANDNSESGEDEFNPLSNAHQFLPLMKKYEVIREFEEYDCIGWGYRLLNHTDSPIVTTETQDFSGSGEPDFSMEKAVCVAIVFSLYTQESLRFALKKYNI
jgi:hypothetical protein